jgi:hypothetical protein
MPRDVGKKLTLVFGSNVQIFILCFVCSNIVRAENAFSLEIFLSNVQREKVEIALAIATDTAQEFRCLSYQKLKILVYKYLYVTCTFYIFVTFNQYSLAEHVFFTIILSQLFEEYLYKAKLGLQIFVKIW